MPNPQFDVIFAADRATIRPISEANYKTGWNHLGSNNVITDDHDYVMRLQDEKMKWLYDAVGFNPSNNVNLPDDNTIDVGSTYNVIMGGAGSDISGGSQNTLMGTYGANIVGAQNTLFVAGGTTVTGQGNVVFRSLGANVTGDDNFLFNTAATLTGIDSCFFVSANGVSTAGSNSDTAVMNSSGASLTDTDGCLVYGSPSVTMNGADNSGVMFTTGSCVITASSASIIESSVASVINDSSRSHILSSNQCTVDGFDNVTIVSSQNVIARKSNTLVLGYGLSAPSTANIKIELDAETGDGSFAGNLDVASFSIGGVPVSSGRLDNLTATTDPTVNDDSSDGYSPLSMWVNTVTNEIFTAISVTPGAANWQLATLTLDNLGNLAVINGTTVGQNLVTLTNPGAIRFVRLNADNTVSTLDATSYRTAIGLGSSATLNADSGISNSTVVQRTSSGNVAMNRMAVSASSSDITFGVGEEISYLWGADNTDPLLFGRVLFGTVVNFLKTGYGMSTVDGDGILFWNKTSTPVQRVQLPFNGSSTGAAMQSDVANGATTVNVVPNGTSNIARVIAISDSAASNGHTVSVGVTATESRIESGVTGSGTYRPLDLYTNGSLSLRLSNDGSVNLAKTGAKITADFSNATFASRTYFETSVANSNTSLHIKPSGTGTSSNFGALNSTDPANCSRIRMSSDATSGVIVCDAVGTGTSLPLTIQVGGLERVRVTTNGDLGVGLTPDTQAKLQTSNGIKLGNSANANANVLDWYEEGTFTPTIIGSVSAGTGTYTVQTGSYTRVGNTVHFSISIGWTAHTGTGTLLVGSLPFAVGSMLSLAAVRFDGLVIGADKQAVAQLQPANTHMTIAICDLAGGSAANAAMAASVVSLRVAGSYSV